MDSFFSFDVSSKVAHFRMEYTTTSALTYPFPTRNNIVGLLGAIGGIGREQLADLQNDAKIGVEILSSLRTRTMGVNVMYGKEEKKGKDNIILFGKKTKKKDERTENVPHIAMWYYKLTGYLATLPVTYEMLLFPRYRIFVKGSGNLVNKILANLCAETTCFTPYLGSMFALARIDNFQEHDNYSQIASKEEVKISTVVPDTSAEVLDFSEIYYARVPCEFEQPQKISKWIRVYYKKRPSKITARVTGDVYDVGEVVALF